tara:strand:+ start:629 stop:1312 length:684 start_codon:yes stop_codon:yes gene_type:complete
MKKLTIIPARSGSKGVKNKNIKDLNGLPMMAWSIIHAKYYSSKEDAVVVSSDSDSYLDIAQKFGAIPHKRAQELSTDECKTEPVMDDVIKNYKLSENDLIVLLQPTSPIRTKITLNKFIESFNNPDCDSALTLANYHGFLWEENGNYKKPLYKERPRRQDMIPRYVETGSVYGTRYKNYLESSNRVSGKISGIIVDFEESLEVDSEKEFEVIKTIFKNYMNDWKNDI